MGVALPLDSVKWIKSAVEDVCQSVDLQLKTTMNNQSENPHLLELKEDSDDNMFDFSEVEMSKLLACKILK